MATRKDYYEPSGRRGHSIEIVGTTLYLWGGIQDNLPRDHDSVEKRLLLSVVDIFNIETGLWNRQNTYGHPPLGVSGYSSTSIRKNIYYFGGWCGHGDCRHNCLSSLNVENLLFTQLYSTNDHESAPVKKSSCGMISFQAEKNEESLLVVGGVCEESPRYKQPGAEYTKWKTNESHIFNITTRKWISPRVSGRRPPPCHSFTLLSFSGNRLILYGGINPDGYRIDTIYISTITGYELNWEIIRKSVGEYPVGRRGHAATVISDCVQEIMITIGGKGRERTLNECWVMDITEKKHKKIHLPDNVTKRLYHSLSSFAFSPTSVLLVVFGGRRTLRVFDVDLISDTHVIELVYTNNEWSVEHVWGMTQLTTNNDDYQRRLKEIQKEGEVLDMIRRSEHLALSSGEQEKEMIRLREENIILHQQLEESSQEVRRSNTTLQETQAQAHQIISQDKQELQDVMESHQQELRRSNTRLQETQVQLQETQVHLQETHVQVQELNQIILEVRQDNQQLHETTQRKQEAIYSHQQEIHRLRSQLENPHWVIQKEEIIMTQKILGTGGWGEVKVGIFRGTKVAVKCLHEVILSEYNLGLFSREMNIASCIRHPNLLQFIGATRVGNLMILTELMPTSLRKELEKSLMSRPHIITIAKDIASALNYLHLWKPHPILHRDVSSANVLLEPSGSSRWKGKLSDYGSANILHQIHTVAPGSPAYAAPEAQSPNLHSPKMDVYSFGVLVVEMATRCLPSTVVFEREEQIQGVQWSSIRALIERCTIRDPQSRPTIDKILQDINAL